MVGVQLPGTVVKLSQSSESWENVRLEAVLLSHRPTSTFKVSTAGNESRDLPSKLSSSFSSGPDYSVLGEK